MTVVSRIFLGACQATSRKYACRAYSGRPVLEMFTKVCQLGGEGGGEGRDKYVGLVQLTELYILI